MGEITYRFRWRYWDAALGDECSACCCGAPDDGEHQQGAEHYDEDGILSNGHTRCDPNDPDPWQTVEYDPPR